MDTIERIERTIRVNGADLYVEERGTGEPLVLLHGVAGTSGDFRHVFDVDRLARSFRVIAPDARGHGRSTNPSEPFTFGGCARDVLAILDALGVERAKAVGVSLGAKTLLHVATRAPERVTAMILVSATPRFPEATRTLFRAAAASEHSAEEWARMRTLHAHGDEQIARLWELPRRFADDTSDMNFMPEQLATITARTLIVSGDRDPFYPVELAVDLYRAIPRSSLWVVPESMHSPIFLSNREAFADEAIRFL
ncbi:MAG: alpha/beta hydrolase [Polyangiaceae bacterium]|nr:alpha/beta hydrolase [Polyangiaceae bacterium]